MKNPTLLLKIANHDDEDSYSVIMELQITDFSINSDVLEIASLQTDQWRKLLFEAGTRSMSVGAGGSFMTDHAETQIRTCALSGTIESFELNFENGDRVRGNFLITRLDYNGEDSYTIELESSGPVAPLDS